MQKEYGMYGMYGINEVYIPAFTDYIFEVEILVIFESGEPTVAVTNRFEVTNICHWSSFQIPRATSVQLWWGIVAVFTFK